jgi:uracil-DNA glycosylase
MPSAKESPAPGHERLVLARCAERCEGTVVVLLGCRVATAFGLRDQRPFSTVLVRGALLCFLPHPSGRNRAWNQPGAIEKARRLLAIEDGRKP